MDVAVVGSGIAGSICSLLLARRGHGVLLVDRDPGPDGGEGWERRGVMQFHLPHAWRGPFRMALHDQLPDVLAELDGAGAVTSRAEGMPEVAAMLLCRRSVLETVLWAAASRQPGIERVTGHADALVVRDGRAQGVVVDGVPYDARLVVDAGGRACKLGQAYRPTPEGGDSGMAYTCQLFRLRPGAEPGPMNSPVGQLGFCAGYQPIVFVHDNDTFSVLIIWPAKDPGLAVLREPAAFAAAHGAIPGLADWTDPQRSEPIGPILTGANLTNLYFGQPDLPGLAAIGDAVATTNPNGARGATLGALGALALAEAVTTDPDDPVAWTAAMRAWSDREVRPWWSDHVAIDASLHRRWRGEAPDPDGFVSTDLVADALDSLPELMPQLGPYFAMLALPTTLDGARETVRELIRGGWVPAYSPGPAREELLARVRAAL
jgi:2-polyprenyl-6-methoxyphenol hydroxylase-like FAD-dependent oxidoreductase